ncbi:MAG: 30S ribosomal protein S6 [Methylocystaceae bacterium]
MRSYEIMYILKPDLPQEAIEAAQEKVIKIITDFGGEMVKVDNWGKRRLAYEINDLTEGFYVLLHFAGTTEAVNELERVLKISEDFIRHLIVRQDEK